VPPFGQDINGILKQITLWNQWQAAGAPIPWDSTFSTSIGGYPLGSYLIAADHTHYWVSTVDNNTSDPDTGGANWNTVIPLTSGAGGNVGTFTRAKITVNAYGQATAATSGAQPTYQKFTNGTGVYTPGASVVRIRVRMCGAGGSGGAGGTTGGAGGDTTFGGWVAKGGSGGVGQASTGAGGAGGQNGANGTGTLINRQSGGAGLNGAGINSSGATYALVTPGGFNWFGGGPNSGAGGIGTATLTPAGSALSFSGGGGAGECVEFAVTGPVAVSWQVGATGVGNAGSAGVILVEEFYD
jgi:hypothetical protein